MAANVRTDMRIPTRAAPRPPNNNNSVSTWNNSHQFLNGSSNVQSTQKKKPPPRPPPPKFTYRQYQQSDKNDRSKKPARPTQLMTNIFSRKTNKQTTPVSYSNNQSISLSSDSKTSPNGTVLLIDLSPPGSPTFTTRSNSDGVSVDSFGSDGNSNPSVFTGSGNTSQTESGFEDDFDFFGGLSSQKFPQNDPWKVVSSNDPFSSIPNTTNNKSSSSKTVGNSDFFAFNNGITESQASSFSSVNSNSGSSMPTIIRAKPAKPPAPKFMQRNLAPTVTDFGKKPVPLKRNAVPYNKPVTLDINDGWNDSFEEEPSPPMPSIPPPAPPPEYLNGIDTEPIILQKPYGIALYDFPASQSDDLPLKEGDVVVLIRAINNDWVEGRVGNRQGMFPANFVDIKVPLPGVPTNIVNALYAFNGETSEDLTFREGAKITVLSRLSEDWLYGEFEGRRGQFPANYVDRIPSHIP